MASKKRRKRAKKSPKSKATKLSNRAKPVPKASKSLADLEVFTTTQVARLCHVSDRTVKNWIDRGSLEGYRLPAGLGQGEGPRRVTRAVLVGFLKANGMPLGGLQEG